MSVYQCGFCSKQSKTLLTTKKHIFANHIYDRRFKLICNIDGCFEKLNNILSLRKHVSKRHRGKTWKMPKSWYRISSVKIAVDQDAISSNAMPISDLNLDGVHQDSLSTSNVTESAKTDSYSSNITPLNDFDFNDYDISYNEHQINLDTSNVNEPAKTDNLINETDDDLSILDNSADQDISTYQQTLKNQSQRQKEMAMALSKLKADCNLTEHSLQMVQEWAEGLLEALVRTIIGGVKHVIGNVSDKLQEVFLLGLGMANPFHGVKHELARKKCLPCFVVSQYIKI